MSSVCTFSQIDASTFSYAALRKNQNNNGKSVIVTIAGAGGGQQRLRFQLSCDHRTDLPTAALDLMPPVPGGDPSRSTLALNIESPELAELLKSIDRRNIKEAAANSVEWFGKQMDEGAVTHMYTPLYREPYREGAKPNVRTKVNVGDDRPTNIYTVRQSAGDGDDPSDQLDYAPGSPADLKRDARCVVVVDTMGLWFMQKQFGMSLSATDILVYPAPDVTGINAFKLPGVRLRKVSEKPLHEVASVPPPCLDEADSDVVGRPTKYQRSGEYDGGEALAEASDDFHPDM